MDGEASMDTVEACLDRMRSAWDRGDAQAYAAEFTDDATYVIFLGEALRGRAEIESTHIDVLGKWQKGTKMAVRPLSIRSLGEGVTSVLTIGGLGRADPIGFDKLQTFVFVRRDGRWKCSAFQNTRMSSRVEDAFNAGQGS